MTQNGRVASLTSAPPAPTTPSVPAVGRGGMTARSLAAYVPGVALAFAIGFVAIWMVLVFGDLA